MKINLIRHGRPDYELKKHVRAWQLGEELAAYNRADIVDRPPQETIEIARASAVVICSNLLRSYSSARALASEAVPLSSELFREAELPYFASGSLRLPVTIWGPLLRGLWLCGLQRNGEALAVARGRAALAAAQLSSLAQQHGTVTLVGHAVINKLIATELRRQGWRGPRQPSRNFWQYASYQFHPEAQP